MVGRQTPHQEYGYGTAHTALPGGPWTSPRSPMYHDGPYQTGGYDGSGGSYLPSSVTYSPGTSTTFGVPPPGLPMSSSRNGRPARSDAAYAPTPAYSPQPTSGTYQSTSATFGPYHGAASPPWEAQSQVQGVFSPSDSMDDIMAASPSLSDYSSMDRRGGGATPPGKASKSQSPGKGRPQRRPSNRDEFDGPHQFLQRPPAEYIAMQERELPHLPTHLLVQEQDSVLSQVNDRLSQCAFDFVAKYQFPIPLTQDMRPVERPQDREWTEWVFLLKRLATKRRIPARVLYNGQIKQFVTILENSLEMRHAAKHQSRPLKDDRNILQLISAGIQVAKILKDAQAMDYLDRLYVSTEKQIQERSAAAAARFRT